MPERSALAAAPRLVIGLGMPLAGDGSPISAIEPLPAAWIAGDDACTLQPVGLRGPVLALTLNAVPHRLHPPRS